MATESKSGFDVDAFLANAGPGRKIVQLRATQAFFSQGDPADCVFYLQKGRVKISVASADGKEATIRLVLAGDFFGEKAMAAEPGLRVTTATAMTACTALKIARPEFLQIMREEQSFSNLFSSFLLACSLKAQADLVDQLFNRAEKRLARLLLLLALRRFAEVTHLCSSEVTLARNGTASSHAVGVAAWFRTSVEGEARGGKSIDIAVSSRAVGAVGFCL
jgi:CRP/FNR family transcriptional regulator, cyclic AMP receptor protein